MLKLKMGLMLLCFMAVFSVLGTISAANVNWTVNPGDSIQAVVNNASAGDYITVNDDDGSEYIYTENIILNKKITLNSVSNNTVIIQARDSSKPVITVNNNGSSSSINYFTVTGGYDGIFLDSTSKCTISGNIISGNNCYGIRLINSSDNKIFGNELGNDGCYGIYLSASNYNEIRGNNVFESCYGIFLVDSSIINYISQNTVRSIMEYPDSTGIHIENSQNNLIYYNNLCDNGQGVCFLDAQSNYLFNNNITDNWEGITSYGHSTIKIYNNIITDGIHIRWGPYAQINRNTISGGIYVQDASADIHFNTITGISYGLFKCGTGTVNATNNWWGTNSVTYVKSQNWPSSYCDIWNQNGNVTYDPWLVLNVTANPASVTDGNSTVTADLTHNSNGGDTSSSGHLPDNIPVNFTTNLGTITNPSYTRNGKATATFNRGTTSSGIATITAILNNQRVQINVTVIQMGAVLAAFTASPTSGVAPFIVKFTDMSTGNINAWKWDFNNDGITDSTQQNPVYTYNTPGTYTVKLVAYDFLAYDSFLDPFDMFNDPEAIDTEIKTNYITVTQPPDITAPTVNANLMGGIYNTTKSVTLTALDNLDSNPVVYYSLNNGSTWNSGVKTVTLTFNQGLTILKFYARDFTSNICPVQSLSYTIDSTAPTVNSSINGGTFNKYPTVILHATDNLDPYPVIYYTTNGDTPTTSSSRYAVPLTIIKTLTLKFMAVDDAGNQATVQSWDYVINTQGQIHIQKFFSESEFFFCDELDESLYHDYVLFDIIQQIPMNESGSWVTVTIKQIEDPLFIFVDNHLRQIYMSEVDVYVDDVMVLNKQVTNGGCLQPSWYWAKWLDPNLLNYFPESRHSRGSRDFVGYDLPYIYSLNRAYNVGDTERVNQIWQDIRNDANITAGDFYFIQHNRLKFQNTFHFTFNYPSGNTVEFVPVIYVNDPGSSFEYINLFPVATVMVNNDRYCSIQAAIDSSKTKDGDTIYVNSGIYQENIFVSKKVTITPVSGSNVILGPLDTSKPVFTITNMGSGSIINGFTIIGFTNYQAILLNSTQNCSITGNVITETNGIMLIDSDYNTIFGNTFSGDNSGGISLDNSSNNNLYDNSVTWVMEDYGIRLSNYSRDNIISGNYIEDVGIYIANHSSARISENIIKNCGIIISNCGNIQIYENDITSEYNGVTGIFLSNSTAEIHFNRISGKVTYGLRVSNNSTVNATNNWWGNNTVTYINSTTTPPTSYNIWNKNSTVFYNPWLFLNIDNISSTNSGGNTSITIDLTHNNQGGDTSSQGHIPNGIPVNFATNFGTIISSAPTLKGKATTILNLGTTQSRTVTVYAGLDNQNVSTQAVIAPGVVIINITSTAKDNSTNQPVSLTYTVPLNSSVTWVSVLWKNAYVFNGELELIVNGVVVKSESYVSPAYLTWRNRYRVEVFRAILCANNLFTQIGLDPDTLPNFWNDTATRYNLNSTELQFVQNHRLEFIDNLTVNLSYPGVIAPAMTITDPQTNSTINLNFTGNIINRSSQILYMDGSLGIAEYEGVKSFAIATTKVTDEIAQYWADQKNATDANGNLLYPRGSMKAAYGTFFTSLMMIYCHDILADAAANEFNVTWSRTHPVIVSVGDDAYQTYLTLECDHSMGITTVGKLSNMAGFNYACSSCISTIEYGIMRNLEFDYQYANFASCEIGSVTQDMLYSFFNGAELEMFAQNGCFIYKIVGRNDLMLIFDSETGIMRDVNTVNGYYGAYCFPNLQTELAYDFFGNVYNNTSSFRNWALLTAAIFNTISSPNTSPYMWGYVAEVTHPGMKYNWENEQHIAAGAGKIGFYLFATVAIGTFGGPYGAAGVLVGGFYPLFIGGMQEIQEYWNNPVWIPEES
ncbi:MAG: parallel beta-helix repeat (two copies) [Methanobacterium sp. Maddingley MBC34]|nr:MAG: parallel beta-helix repeat (two copies) [Methanobacterium sp. Maddingley MBC34]